MTSFGKYGAMAFVAIASAAGQAAASDETEGADMAARLRRYDTVRLTTDTSALSANEKQIIRLLIEAAEQMDRIFWLEAYGDREALLARVTDPLARQYALINYGPWDRLADNEPFIPGVGPKPLGAAFYPPDMTKEEFESHLAANPADADTFKSQYTVIRRGTSRELLAIPYHKAFAEPVQVAAGKLRAASELAEDEGLKRYLTLREDALLIDDYRASDIAWLEMTDNTIDVIIGPIETYEDALFGYKAAHEAYVLVKDRAWSQRLSKYAALLPDLQRGLPAPEKYKAEEPGSDSQLGAYDVIYYAGDCNAGSKTIAVNLPNDETVQLEKGTRRLQLKNAMRAKFDRILVPIADMLIAEDQRKHITFDAFFANTMFHEVAHGLGIKNTLNGKGTVREALKDQASALEEGKADVLGLYMVTKLHEEGELGDAPLEDYYVTFMASVFRSVRFGAASAHGRANMLRFNYFKDADAFSYDEKTGTYRVHIAKMQAAMTALSHRILTLQGDGDYDAVKTLMETKGAIGPDLQKDLDRVGQAGIPVDIVFEQGLSVLGL